MACARRQTFANEMSQVLKPSAIAIDTLEQLLVKANNDLSYVQGKLEAEFNGRKVDPFKLIERIKAIQDELPQIQRDCEKLMAAKQDLIDTTKEILVANRALARRMQARTGIPICCDDEDPVFSAFTKVLHEWNDQVQSGEKAVENGTNESEDLNEKLFL